MIEQVWILIQFDKLLLSIILFKLVHAFFEYFTNTKLVLRHLFVFEEKASGFFLLFGEAVAERCDHLVALIELYLNKRLYLIYNVNCGEDVTSI